MMQERELIHAETQIEIFGNPEDGWYTYAEQADDPIFKDCEILPMHNQVFVALNIPPHVWLTGFYHTEYETLGACLHRPHQDDSPEKRKSKVMKHLREMQEKDDINDIKQFCTELHTLLKRHKVMLGVDLDGDTHGLSMDFCVVDRDDKTHILSHCSCYLDASDLKDLD